MKVLKYKDKSGEYQDLYETYKEPDPFNGYDYVDMGEAGIWATCNVGASKPEEYGLYFAWGETEGYPDTSGDKKFSLNDYKYGTSSTNFIKYNSSDGLETLEPEDDAAHVNMGGKWRMPTEEEFQKLIDLCTDEFINGYNGTNVKGWMLKLKTDESKQLFFPYSGLCINGTVKNVREVGYYWSSSLTANINKGYEMNLGGSGIHLSSAYDRYYGLSIRGFIPKSE